jgi:hypothetical protein
MKSLLFISTFFATIILPVSIALAEIPSPTAADAQGWSGPGWYVTGSASFSVISPVRPDYILFEGPHPSRAACATVYARLYSPIGMCRLIEAKPGT